MDKSSRKQSQDQRSTSTSRPASDTSSSTENSSAFPAFKYFTPLANSSTNYESPYARNEDSQSQHLSLPTTQRRVDPAGITSRFTDSPRGSETTSPYISSSRDSPVYDPPEARGQYTAAYMASSSKSANPILSPNNRDQLLRSLQTHRVNTLTELRRLEKLLTTNGSTPGDVTEAMATAWTHYVNSNNLLSELRGLTKDYPFSSECLNEAKAQVISKPSGIKSWNYAWLVLTKLKTESLIQKHALVQARDPLMWGGRTPSQRDVDKLAQACVSEWTKAVEQMLRQWSTPPTQ